MARRRVTFEVVDKGARLRRFEGALARPRFALEGIGALMEGASEKAFREEKLGKIAWKKRSETGMVPNWPAILAHFAAKATDPPARFFGDKDTLLNTGDLAGSIKSRVVGKDEVVAGSRLPYASVLHTGGKSETVQITAVLQERMWKWMKKARKKKDRWAGRLAKAKEKGPEAFKRKAAQVSQEAKVAGMTGRLGWLLNKKLRGKTLEVNHPARPLVGLPDETVQEIEELYGLRVAGRR